MTDQTTGPTPHDPSQPLTFTAPTPPAFTPPPAPPAPHPEATEDELEDDEQPSAPEPHSDARGLGVTGKFPVPAANDEQDDDEVEQ